MGSLTRARSQLRGIRSHGGRGPATSMFHARKPCAQKVGRLSLRGGKLRIVDATARFRRLVVVRVKLTRDRLAGFPIAPFRVADAVRSHAAPHRSRSFTRFTIE